MTFQKFHVSLDSPTATLQKMKESSHSRGLLKVAHNGQDLGNPGGPRATAEALTEWPFPAAPLPLIVFW